MTEGLTADDQGGFRSRKGCVNEIVTQKQIWDYGFYGCGKAYDRFNREALR